MGRLYEPAMPAWREREMFLGTVNVDERCVIATAELAGGEYAGGGRHCGGDFWGCETSSK